MKSKMAGELATIYIICGRDSQLKLAIALIYETRMFAKLDMNPRVVSSRGDFGDAEERLRN
jgi:hypothetical protein